MCVLLSHTFPQLRGIRLLMEIGKEKDLRKSLLHLEMQDFIASSCSEGHTGRQKVICLQGHFNFCY